MGSNPTSSLLTFAWPMFVFLITFIATRTSKKDDLSSNDFEESLVNEGGGF